MLYCCSSFFPLSGYASSTIMGNTTSMVGPRLRVECMGTASLGGYSHCKVANSDSNNCYDFDILKGRIFLVLWGESQHCSSFTLLR